MNLYFFSNRIMGQSGSWTIYVVAPDEQTARRSVELKYPDETVLSVHLIAGPDTTSAELLIT